MAEETSIQDPDQVPLITDEWITNELDGNPPLVRMKRLELVCSVHWPEYDWKLLRTKYIDNYYEDGHRTCIIGWTGQMGQWLRAGRESKEYIALLSVKI